MSDFHTYSSWGRTRQPKNIAGAHKSVMHGNGITLPTAVPTLATDGHKTENQRFIHILVENTDNTKNHQLTLWGFSYASGKWGKIYDTSGSQIQIDHLNQALNRHYIFEIAGVDRVYLQDSGVLGQQLHADDQVYAATSTF